MKKYFEGVIRALLLMLILFSRSFVSFAQIIVNSASLTYQQNFNSLDTSGANSNNLPNGWYIIENGTASTVNDQYKGNSGTSTTGDVYSYGSAGQAERALGSLATSGCRGMYGAVFKNNTGTTISKVCISYRGEQWRRGTCASDTLFFRYSSIASSLSDTVTGAWTAFPRLSFISPNSGSPNNTALNGNVTGDYIILSDTLSVNIPSGDSLWICWSDKDVTGSDDGLAIDDLSVTFITSGTPIPENIYLTSKSPSGINIDPSVNKMFLHFDHLIEQGNGQISLHAESGAVTTFQTPSSQMTITDSTATINNILLENNSRYYVQMTEGAFVKAGDTIKNTAIADTTSWTFNTTDTVIIRPLTILNESFESCPDATLGIFKPYNSLGFKTWKCNSGGHSGLASASMSGGIPDGISDSNEDWLISQRAFDFSTMSRPELSFWQKRRFDGVVGRSVRISTDYIPGSNPVLATWNILQVQDMMDEPSEDWTPIADIDLSPYKNTPFYLAFTYSSGEQGAYELNYDDIKVEDEALKIEEKQSSSFSIKVLGEATGQRISLSIITAKEMNLNVDVFDVNGRSCFKTQLNIRSGEDIYNLNNSGLKPGLYFIRIGNAAFCKTRKILIAR